MIAWTVLMFGLCFAVIHAHAIPITGYGNNPGGAGGGPCGWAGPNPHAISGLAMGVAGIAGLAAIPFPLFAGPAAILIGALGGIWEGVLTMNQC